jgi:hypothetical protein
MIDGVLVLAIGLLQDTKEAVDAGSLSSHGVTCAELPGLAGQTRVDDGQAIGELVDVGAPFVLVVGVLFE